MMVIINWADSSKLNSNPAKGKAEKQFDMHVEATKYLEIDTPGAFGNEHRIENRRIVWKSI